MPLVFEPYEHSYYSLMPLYLELSFTAPHSLPPTRTLTAFEGKGFFPPHNNARNCFLEEGALWGKAHVQRSPGKSHQGGWVKNAAMLNFTYLTILVKARPGRHRHLTPWHRASVRRTSVNCKLNHLGAWRPEGQLPLLKCYLCRVYVFAIPESRLHRASQ